MQLYIEYAVLTVWINLLLIKNAHLRGSESGPSLGLLFGLLALGQPERLRWVA